MDFWKPTNLKPWQPGESEVVAKGYGKTFVRKNFRNPTSGEVQDFFLIGQRDWSTILPITTDGQVIAERQYKQGCNKIYIDLPAGTTNFDKEPPSMVAERELLEETGYKAEETIFLGPPLWMCSRNSETRFWPFVAIGCTKIQDAKIDVNEEIEVLTFPLADWLQFCQTQLEDHSAYVATFRALPHIREYLPNFDLANALGIK